MRTIILICWLLLAFNIIREASSAACTTSPTATELVMKIYSHSSCTGTVSNTVTVPNNVCSPSARAFSPQYILADCAKGSYSYYTDAACTIESITFCQNSCDMFSAVGLCKYVKWATTMSKWRISIAQFFLLCICINLHTTKKIPSFFKSRKQKIPSFMKRYRMVTFDGTMGSVNTYVSVIFYICDLIEY